MKSIIYFIILISCFVRVNSVDLPVFYRAPLYCGGSKKTHDNWQSSLDIRYARGHSSKSYNRHEKKVPLFGVFGKTDITRLGIGIENKGTRTAQLWQEPTVCSALPSFNNLPVPDECEGNDGLIEFCGTVKAEQLDLTFEQVLFSGFYAQVHAPIRSVCVDRVGFKHSGKSTVNGINVDDFVLNDLPVVLQEAGYDIKDGQNLASYGRFKKSEIPDLLIAVGWGGRATDSGSIVSFIQGSVQIGATIPIGGKKDQNQLFAFPLGYDQHYGAQAHTCLELGFYKVFVLGAGLGTTIFFNEHRCLRMKTDVHQSGWFVLDRGKAHIKKGSLWDVHAYLRADKVLYGLSAVLGYSFTHEENTQLRVKDHCFLKSVIERELACRFLVSRDYVANKDQRLKSWQQQVIHFMAEYDFSVHGTMIAPVIRGEISIPFANKRAFAMTMYGVIAGLTARWPF